MHVALCTDGIFPQALGGMQRHSRLLAEHLARRGDIRLTVLHPHPLPVFDHALGIREVRVPDIDRERLYLRELWRYSQRVGAELEALRPDVILSQGFCVWHDAARHGDRLIVHPHGLEMFQGLTLKERVLGAPFRIALRHIIRRGARVVSLGGRLTDILRAQVSGSGCEVVAIPNAVDVPERPLPMPVRAAEEPLELLFVGRFAFNKGLDVLMRVARRLEASTDAPSIRFLLAGDGPLLDAMRAAGLPAQVQLLGRVDDATLEQCYARCDALVLPTRFEGMPTVVLEAMARARPILVSDVGATAELVDATNGYLLPAGDADALERAMRAFAALPPERRAAMGQASWTRVSQRFSWPAATARFVELFHTVNAAAAARPTGGH